MQKESNKFTDSTVLEGMVSIRSLLEARKEGRNDRKILKILYNRDRLKKIGKEIAFLRHEGERSEFTVEGIGPEEIEAVALGTSHGGILALCSERTIPPLTSLAPERIPKNGFFVMMEGIEDPYNFGYALRSLYAMGATGVVLPPRNWMSAAGVVARASAGASELFDLYIAGPEEAAAYFKKRQYTIVCADANTENNIEDTPIPFPVFLLIGGEKRGNSANSMKMADKIVRISYGRPFAAALSAASATTILAYEIARQNRKMEE